MHLTSVFCAGEVLSLPKKYPRARQVSGHDFSRAVTMHLTSVILSDSEGASRPEEESKDPDDACCAMPHQGVLTRIDFPAVPAKESAADLANQFLTEFFQQDSNVQPACIRAENSPPMNFFSACEREGAKSSSCSGQPTALELTSKIISPRGPRCSSRFVLSSSLSSWFQLQAAVVAQSPRVDQRPRQYLRRRPLRRRCKTQSTTSLFWRRRTAPLTITSAT